MRSSPDYDQLVGEAVGVPITGWEFAWLDGRAVGSDPSWSYPELARPLLRHADSLLDLDTGGGELLVELAPLPAHTVAVESWAPNVPVARDRLTRFGVSVVTELPGEENEFDVVLSRHGRLPAEDIARLLRPGGTLLSQQVGSDDLKDLNAELGAPPPYATSWTAKEAVAALEAAGLTVRPRAAPDRRPHPHPGPLHGDRAPIPGPGVAPLNGECGAGNLCELGLLSVRSGVD
jgi:SAM-dependent methyltransferase